MGSGNTKVPRRRHQPSTAAPAYAASWLYRHPPLTSYMPSQGDKKLPEIGDEESNSRAFDGGIVSSAKNLFSSGTFKGDTPGGGNSQKMKRS